MNDIYWDYTFMNISLSDLISKMAGERCADKRFVLLDEIFWLKHRMSLLVQGMSEGWKTFDWAKAHELGWFSQSDYENLEELRVYYESRNSDAA